jgi:ABC-type transport system involved in cytochrome c biogenesis permease subunit
VGALIGNTDKYAALTDFFSPSGYKLESAVASDLSDRRLREVDERVAMVTMVCTGSAFKVFPIPESASGSKADAADGRVEWYSFASRPPLQADSQTYIFMSTCLDNITREVYHRQWKNAADELLRLREFQEAHAPAGTIPSERLNALERFYNAAGSPLLPAILCLLLGLWTLSGRLPLAMRIGECALFLWLTFLLALRWIIGGHLPLSNGFETMSAMAWLSLLAAVAASLSRRRLPLLEPAALIVAGLALMVAYMGRSGATVSHLMPVLASPLLSIHVLLVMASYALLAIIAILSAAALWQRCKAASQAASQAAAQCRRLTATSAMLLYPAVFLLAIGIFVGAVWANQSWGRYWGWDPKETWALITLLIYALPLHSASFTRFSTPAPEAPSAPEDTTPEASPSAASAEPSRRRKPTGRLLNIYLLLAFLSVLMTYFGVNYLLSGMHSYA